MVAAPYRRVDVLHTTTESSVRIGLGRNEKGVLTPGGGRDRPASLVDSSLALPIHIHFFTQHFPRNFFRNFWRDVSHGEHAWPVSAPTCRRGPSFRCRTCWQPGFRYPGFRLGDKVTACGALIFEL